MEATIIEDGRSSAKFSGPLFVRKSTDLWINDAVRAYGSNDHQIRGNCGGSQDSGLVYNRAGEIRNATRTS
jgi:hypothetical protein